MALGLLHQCAWSRGSSCPACSRSACSRSHTIAGRSDRGRRWAHRGTARAGRLSRARGDLQPAQHAARERARESVEHRLRAPSSAIACSMPLASRAPGHAGDAAVEVEVLICRERAVDRDRLRDVADAGAHREAVVADVESGHERAPGGRRQKRGEHADRGRLAGAVRARAGRTPRRARRRTRCRRRPRARRSARRGRRRAPRASPRGALSAGGRCCVRLQGLRRRERALACGVQLADLALNALARLAQLVLQLGELGGAWRTSSSWRSMWPSASLEQLAAALGVDVLAAQLCAHLGARILGREQRLRAPRATRRAGPSGASPRASARPRPRCRCGAGRRVARAPPASSPISS